MVKIHPTTRNLNVLFAFFLISTSSADLYISRSVFGTGTGGGQNPDHFLNGTVGQLAIGKSTGVDWILQSGFWDSQQIPTAASDQATLPTHFQLTQNHPNPFNPTTTIRYAVPRASEVIITLYDLQGRQVDVLLHDFLDPAGHDLNYQANELSSGVYIYRMQANSFSKTRKFILLK